MANLAIRGHATRGKEVIELLEMLGGKNVTNYDGSNTKSFYFLNNIIICSSYGSGKLLGIDCYSLEQFLEKFPYKVGDKAFAFGNKCTIIDAVWDEGIDELVYTIKLDTRKYTTTKLSNELQPHKEEIMEEKENSIVVNIEHKQLKVNSLRFDKTQLVINDEYELKQERDAYYIVRKKPQYPKTYEECCKIIHSDPNFYVDTHLYSDTLESLYKLLICRDAYWEIAGEQLGLGKPWEPDTCQIVYSIGRDSNRISFCNDMFGGYFILEFTTVEMRDAFYENFKDLIEQCKELL